jgi:hypothetical protein
LTGESLRRLGPTRVTHLAAYVTAEGRALLLSGAWDRTLRWIISSSSRIIFVTIIIFSIFFVTVISFLLGEGETISDEY